MPSFADYIPKLKNVLKTLVSILAIKYLTYATLRLGVKSNNAKTGTELYFVDKHSVSKLVPILEIQKLS